MYTTGAKCESLFGVPESNSPAESRSKTRRMALEPRCKVQLPASSCFNAFSEHGPAAHNQEIFESEDPAVLRLIRRNRLGAGALEAARMFIDQLEMLEIKAKGNLDADEANLLKQSLMSLRLAFVEAVEAPAKTQSAPATSGSAPVTPQAGETKPEPSVQPGTASDESKKKFSKKY